MSRNLILIILSLQKNYSSRDTILLNKSFSKHLLQSGADSLLEDSEGRTAEAVAREFRNFSTADIISRSVSYQELQHC
jgi:hypothetical protein